MIHKLTETETVLADDYPVYAGYVYIADNVIIRSHIIGKVYQLKQELNVKEIRRCDIFAHPGAKIGDSIYSDYTKI